LYFYTIVVAFHDYKAICLQRLDKSNYLLSL
jgi:hypothetical protein